MYKFSKLTVLTSAAVLLFSVQQVSSMNVKPVLSEKKDVLNHYADLAKAQYSDSLTTAKTLQGAVEALIAKPTEANLQLAKQAWKDSRVPYQQTEVYRFGNAIVDDWEGKVNAWPLDEGLIDYVATDYGSESDENALYTANVIANKSLKLSGKTIDVSNITKELLATTLHEVDGVEANVATGYHAIEFLLWGQDLNGTGPGAGARPASDFDVNNCTGGNCGRRAKYLSVATDLLIDDLQWIVEQWSSKGEARVALLKDEAAGISTILTGMGSLSYGELAGERIKLGVLLHDPEEEHDCFSDNTHNSHYYDILGIQNVYMGNYKAIDGSQLTGPSIADFVAKKDAVLNKELLTTINGSLLAAGELVKSAEKEGVAYDQLLAEGNTVGNQKILSLVDALLAQTKSIEKVVASLNISPIEFEGSDSLDAPKEVFK